jgi:RNA polymerase sigma-70 factor, ECF subfamily
VTTMPSPADAAHEQTWLSYRAELVRFVTGRVGDEALADDIVHDVLLKALSQLESLADPTKLRAWLYRITRNTIVDYYRARRPSEPLPEDLQADSPQAARRAEQELAPCLIPLLGTLPAVYRNALTLAEIDGLPQREIARREGLSLSGAKTRVQRARRMVRDAILDCCRVELDRRGSVAGYELRGECDHCESEAPADCLPHARGAPRAE